MRSHARGEIKDRLVSQEYALISDALKNQSVYFSRKYSQVEMHVFC
jgi:hypothetical protein